MDGLKKYLVEVEPQLDGFIKEKEAAEATRKREDDSESFKMPPMHSDSDDDIDDGPELLARGVLREVQGSALEVCRHARACRVVEKALKLAGSKSCDEFLGSVTGSQIDEWLEVLGSPQGSRAVEAAVARAGSDAVTSIVRTVLGRPEFATRACPNVYLATSLAVAAQRVEATEVLKPWWRGMIKWLSEEDDLLDSLCDVTAGKLVQAFLNSLAGTRRGKKSRAKVAQILLRLSPDQVSTLVCHRAGSHVAEAWVALLSRSSDLRDGWHQFLQIPFTRGLAKMALDPCGNHVAQRVLELLNEKPLAAGFANTLAESQLLQQMVAQNRLGVAARLTESLSRLHVDRKVCKAWVRAIADAVLPEVASARSGRGGKAAAFPVLELLAKAPSVGPLLVSSLLSFRNGVAEPLVLALCEVDVQKWLGWIQGGPYSRMAESFVNSPGLSTARRAEWAKQFRGKFVQLALNKTGSHFVEKLFHASDVDTRQMMLDELSESIDELATVSSGKWVLKSCKVQFYAKKRDLWLERASGDAAKRKLFEDLLRDDGEDGEVNDHGDNDDDDDVPDKNVSKERNSRDKKQQFKKRKVSDELNAGHQAGIPSSYSTTQDDFVPDQSLQLLLAAVRKR